MMTRLLGGSLLAAMSGMALTLGGCVPATQGVTYQALWSEPVKLSRSEAFAVLYGTSHAVAPPRLPRDSVVAPRQNAETAEIYSADWQQLEVERESRLKNSSAICRC